jgi:hypothetical protein
MEKSYHIYKYQDLIETLLDSAIVCERCANRSQQDNIMQRCMQLNRDAVELFKQAVKLLKHESEIAPQYVQLCEEMSKMCIEECNTNMNIDYVKACADACSQCAEVCKTFRTGMLAPKLSAA